MLPKLAWGADTNYMQRLTGKRVAPRAGKGRYSAAKGVAGRMPKKKKNNSSGSHASFKDALENAGNPLCSLCLAAALRYQVAPATQTCN